MLRMAALKHVLAITVFYTTFIRHGQRKVEYLLVFNEVTQLPFGLT